MAAINDLATMTLDLFISNFKLLTRKKRLARLAQVLTLESISFGQYDSVTLVTGQLGALSGSPEKGSHTSYYLLRELSQ